MESENSKQILSPEILSIILNIYLRDYTWFSIAREISIADDGLDAAELTDLFALTLVNKDISSEFHRWSEIKWYLPLEQKSLFSHNTRFVIDYFLKILSHTRIVIKDDGRGGDYERAINIEYHFDNSILIGCQEYEYDVPYAKDISLTEICLREDDYQYRSVDFHLPHHFVKMSHESICRALNIPTNKKINPLDLMRFDHVWFDGKYYEDPML
jgi:hypothetical protein